MTMVVMAVLAAFGTLCALWVGFGWLVFSRQKVVMIYLGPEDEVEAAIRCHEWMRGIGLVKGQLIVIGDGLPENQCQILRKNSEICTLAQIQARLERERDG
jgi:hypothetical protein